MLELIRLVLATLVAAIRCRQRLVVENLLLRQQPQVASSASLSALAPSDSTDAAGQPGRRAMRRAQQAAADRGSSAFALEPIVSSPAGAEILARLLDLRRISAMKEQAITAQDYETAARHREEEKRAREAFVKALEAWRAELNPPEAGS